MMRSELIVGDSLERMEDLSDNLVDLFLFSPPYDDLRDYNGFVLDLPRVGRIISKKVKDGGVCVMVIQDSTKNFMKSCTTFHTISNWVSETDLKLWECCIYNRKATPGAWWKYRFSVDHEYIPIFFKGKRPQYFNKDHMMIPNPSAGVKTRGTVRGKDGEMIPIETIGNPMMCCGTVIHYKNSKREKPEDWKIKCKHPATFPEKLASDFIQAFTEEEMLVVDPFMGSGTVGVQCKKLNRNFIGYDISEEYVKIAEERINLCSSPSNVHS